MQLMMSRLPDQETMVDPPLFTGNSSGGAAWLDSTNAHASTGDPIAVAPYRGLGWAYPADQKATGHRTKSAVWH